MRVAVVFNPRAHGGRTGARRDALIAAFRTRGLEADFHATEGPGHATELVAGLPTGHDAVAVAGGDGTLFEVVNGLMCRPEARRLPLGLLPLGTGNAFSRDLGLEPGAFEASLDAIAGGSTRAVDVAEATGPSDHFHFVNMLGTGFVARAARAALALKSLGRSAYTLGALAALVRMRGMPLELDLDGERLPPEDVFFVEVANSRFTGTRFLMAPQARIDDGLLDVVVVRSLPRRRALRLFPTIYDGRHVAEPEVSVRRARTLRLRAPAGRACIVDGEFRGRTPLEITCRPGALRVFVFTPGRRFP